MRTSQSAPAKNGSVAPSALAPVPSPPATMPSPPALPAPAPESPLLFAPAPVAPLPLLPHPMRSDDTARTGSTIVRCSEKAATPSRNPRKTPFSAPCVGRYTTAMACHVESQAGSAASAVAPTPATTSASAWADAPPHSSIVTAVATAGGGAHSTHAQAENGTSPPSGSATGARARGAEVRGRRRGGGKKQRPGRSAEAVRCEGGQPQRAAGEHRNIKGCDALGARAGEEEGRVGRRRRRSAARRGRDEGGAGRARRAYDAGQCVAVGAVGAQEARRRRWRRRR